jgi:multisubunit Na+/H+ antiporter MnhF subunit
MEGRILTLHTATLVLLALVMDFVAVFRNPYFMDAVLILPLLAFLGTLASARYRSARKIF